MANSGRALDSISVACRLEGRGFRPASCRGSGHLRARNAGRCASSALGL